MRQPSLIPSGHSSVMAGRQVTDADDLDYFPTPPWAARAGGELIARLDPGSWSCWEPACGGGHMAHGLADYFDEVFATDIHDHGFGEGGVDFLDPLSAPDGVGVNDCFDWIVTNPPFKLGEAFVRAALKRARRGVAMLLRLQFKEGGGRYRLFHDAETRIAAGAPFAERVPMVKGRWDPDASSATAYCWFIWMTDAAVAASPMRAAIEANWAHGGYLELTVAPGAKAALTRPSDLVRFCGGSDQGDLLGGGA